MKSQERGGDLDQQLKHTETENNAFQSATLTSQVAGGNKEPGLRTELDLD